MDEFKRNYRASVGRRIHRLARIATQKYWHGLMRSMGPKSDSVCIVPSP
ncbi:MAG TPA: hypothetical protein O0X66_07910 [Methanocorpusculum sp.]|nr:hypothetical protein [Methanocorpusculum sp.]HJJ54401.1 hypothetical protein [Methanocorpusculum sp.]